jgi:hypothetical protein
MWPTPFSAYQVTLADPSWTDSERRRAAQESLNSVDVRKYPFLDSQLAAAAASSPGRGVVLDRVTRDWLRSGFTATRQVAYPAARAGAVVIGGDNRGLGVVRSLGPRGIPAWVVCDPKPDPGDGRPKLLDLNPRVWGWHTLGRRAGVDFAHLQLRVSHGEPCPSARARPSVRWVRLTADPPAALREVAGGRLAVGRYLRSLRDPLECAVRSAGDPLPALAEVALAV